MSHCSVSTFSRLFPCKPKYGSVFSVSIFSKTHKSFSSSTFTCFCWCFKHTVNRIYTTEKHLTGKNTHLWNTNFIPCFWTKPVTLFTSKKVKVLLWLLCSLIIFFLKYSTLNCVLLLYLRLHNTVSLAFLCFSALFCFQHNFEDTYLSSDHSCCKIYYCTQFTISK